MLGIFYQSVLYVDLLQCLGTVRVVVTYIRVHILQQVFFGGNVVEVRGMMDDGRLRELGIRPVLHLGHFLMVLYQLGVGKASERYFLGLKFVKSLLF